MSILVPGLPKESVMAKKKSPSGGKRPNRRPPPAPAGLPDRRAMEGVIRQFTAQLQGNAGAQTPAGRAQDLVYSAFEERDEGRRIQIARDALAIDPDCADAYVLLAEHTPGRKERLDLYEKAVAAGERSLGEAFERSVGHFWGVVETRPYMRARLGLATTLWEFARRDEAVGHLQEMLRLNPNDNQGVRYTLAGFLLFLDRDEELSALIDRYGEEESAFWAYTRALLAFRHEGDTIASRRLLKAARKVNRFVPAYIVGDEMPPPDKPDSYSPGAESEALVYIGQCLIGWRSTAGAVAWVRRIVRAKKKDEEPKGKGPLGFVKKWLTTNLSLKDDVWQADFRRVPNWLRIGGEFTRPWVVLVTNPAEESILAHELPAEAPTPALVWDTVVKAMQHPAAGTPHRPGEIQVPPGETWESLRPHFEEVGVRLNATEDLAELDEVFSAVYEQICGQPEPGLLDIEGVTPEKAAVFYDAAAYYFRQAPWKKIGYEGPVRVECATIPGGPWFAVVIGQAGMTTGLALYNDLHVLQGLRPDATDEENARRSVSTAVIYGEPWNVPVADMDAAERHGWPVARDDAYPHVMHTDGEMAMRLPSAGELELMEACLRALPGFVERRRQDDTTRDEVTVQTTAGPVKLALAWVPEGERAAE
jgi:tetratricopeptide (TPR) repeat protein